MYGTIIRETDRKIHANPVMRRIRLDRYCLTDCTICKVFLRHADLRFILVVQKKK